MSYQTKKAKKKAERKAKVKALKGTAVAAHGTEPAASASKCPLAGALFCYNANWDRTNENRGYTYAYHPNPNLPRLCSGRVVYMGSEAQTRNYISAYGFKTCNYAEAVRRTGSTIWRLGGTVDIGDDTCNV